MKPKISQITNSVDHIINPKNISHMKLEEIDPKTNKVLKSSIAIRKICAHCRNFIINDYCLINDEDKKETDTCDKFSICPDTYKRIKNQHRGI